MSASTRGCLKLLTASFLLLVSFNAFSEDWAISATGSCAATLGSTTNSGGGLKAAGGTAVVKCPLTKELGSSAINSVYARMKRASSAGASTFCYIYSASNYGTPTNLGYGYAAAHTSNQSVSVSIPTLYFAGYADLYCVLNAGDTLFGVRYRQDN